MITDPKLDESEAYSAADVQDVDAEIGQIRKLLRVDGEFFIEFFLNEQLDMPVPGFHVEIWNLLTDQEKERILLAIPRDHAKTTLAKLVVVWYWLFTPHRFCVYLSNTNPIAKAACKDIWDFLQTPNFVKVFGKIRIVKASENESLWQFDLPLPGGRWKRCILRAVGQGQQMRGINIDNQRPDIAVVDDVEDNENTETEFQQKKLDKWIFGPFIKALARRKKIIWLGNMLAKTSLLARMSRMPRWNPVVFGCLVKDTESQQLEPLWPGKWDVPALREDLQEYKENGLVETWMCEMMNMPGHGENGFTSDQIYYRPQPMPDELVACFLTIDPAFGKDSDADESSIAVQGILADGTYMTVSVAHGRWDEQRLFDEALALAMYWGAWTWGIESVAAQRLLLPLFKIFLTQRQLNHHVEMVPLPGSREAKSSRIRAYVGLMAKKEWAIYEGDLDITTQVLNYNFTKKKQADDIIDSCAYGPIMLEVFLGLIMAQAAGKDVKAAGKARFGTEVAGV